MIFDDLFQYIPHLRLHALHKTFRALDIVGKVLLHQFPHHKRLEELQRHPLGEATLVQLQLRADHDNGTTGVVHAFTEQVLTEASLFTFEHI